MRLLEALPNGDFALTKDLPDNAIPPYAILSHRWENDDQEVTYGDMVKGLGRDKAGYDKIKFCGERATRDGLQYFWVDSCCIDKLNEGEHQKAIQSMFYWYRRASRCYVYLPDVSVSPCDNNDIQSWELDFRNFMVQPDLSTIRTLCLMVIAKQTTNATCRSFDSCWTFLGLVTRAAVSIDLNRQPNPPNQSAEAIREWHSGQILWSLILYLCIYIATITGKLPLISVDDLGTKQALFPFGSETTDP